MTLQYLCVDNPHLSSLSPYLAASPSISYFTIGTHIKVHKTTLSVGHSLLNVFFFFIVF